MAGGASCDAEVTTLELQHRLAELQAIIGASEARADELRRSARAAKWEAANCDAAHAAALLRLRVRIDCPGAGLLEGAGADVDRRAGAATNAQAALVRAERLE